MLIAQITDLHIGFDRDDPDEFNLRRLRAVLDRIAGGPRRPDLLLLTGDLTEHGDAASYDRLLQALSACPVPVAAMVGNHDLRGPMLAAFPASAGPDGFAQFALEWDAFRLVALDTLEEGRHGGAFCEARAAWLSATLAERPETPTLIALHHPPFETGIGWLDSDEREPWIARLARALAGHDQIIGMIGGHLHRTIHRQWLGISTTVCGSTAPACALDLTDLDPATPDGRAMITDEPPVYALHRWDGSALTSHVEAPAGFAALARFDEAFQPVVAQIAGEKAGLGSGHGSLAGGTLPEGAPAGIGNPPPGGRG